jgi:Protein of unknown function (DUF3810)
MGKWSRNRWTLGAIVLTMLLWCLGMYSPDFTSYWFTRGFFQVVRVLYDYSFGLLPWPGLCNLFMLIGCFWWLRRKRGLTIYWRRTFVLGLVWILISFFWLWGFNYTATTLCRVPMAYPTNQELFDWLLQTQQKVEGGAGVGYVPLTEAEVRERMELYLESRAWPTLGRVRSRAWYDGGAWRYLGISGIYLPWNLEGLTSASHHQAQLSFIRAHEMAHGYGIAREGEADFCAHQCLKVPLNRNSDDAASWFANYDLWTSLRNALYQRDYALFLRADSLVGQDLRRLHEEVKSQSVKYLSPWTGVAVRSNDLYLKSMGMGDGVANYDQMVGLLWEERIGRVN